MPTRVSTVALTIAALTGFAANSVLCRMALGSGTEIDAMTFTTVRILSGAITLAILIRLRGSGSPGTTGSWTSAGALFAYAIAFSLAYLRLGTGAGALILFGVVQMTMISAGLRAGERPRPMQWMGLLLAFGGLAGLSWPGLTAPDPVGAALMALAGVAWGIYSLRGRKSSRPLFDTAGNFLRAVPFAALLSVVMMASAHASLRGLALATASGAFASGVGYSVWYSVLPRLSATRAAIVQLSVPVLAAAGGIVFLGEPVTQRLLLNGATILAGVLLAIGAGLRR